MNTISNYLLLLFFLLSSCEQKKDNQTLRAFSVYCEMVSYEVKPMSLNAPMETQKVDQIWDEFLKIAEKYEVKLYREDDFPVSVLFPGAHTDGKTVVMIYRGDRLEQYKQWKQDQQSYKGNDPIILEALGRRFGRLMGYTPQGINRLLMKNTDYRSLAHFGVKQQITHLYYEDLNEALQFYAQTLGLKKIDSSKFQIGEDVYIALHPLNEQHGRGQAKSTAIALLTDQLAEWYKYLQTKEVQIKYTYKPREGGPHDGFVAIDPGGYLLEFEQFKQHPENELFMAVLAQATKLETSVEKLPFYGSITWTYHHDLLKMQQFYEETLGYRLVADQGWTKIYQTSKTGFIGLVDERRGMEDYADTKAVEIEWLIEDEKDFREYANQFWKPYQYQNGNFIGPEKYIYQVQSKQ